MEGTKEETQKDSKAGDANADHFVGTAQEIGIKVRL